jgi:hypothetical protein
MLSVVDISFSRYPASFGNSVDTIKGAFTTLNADTTNTTPASGTDTGAVPKQ